MENTPFDGDHYEYYRLVYDPEDVIEIEDFLGMSINEVSDLFDEILLLCDPQLDSSKLIYIPRSDYFIVPQALFDFQKYAFENEDDWAKEVFLAQTITEVLDEPIELTPYFHLVTEYHIPYTRPYNKK